MAQGMFRMLGACPLTVFFFPFFIIPLSVGSLFLPTLNSINASSQRCRNDFANNLFFPENGAAICTICYEQVMN